MIRTRFSFIYDVHKKIGGRGITKVWEIVQMFVESMVNGRCLLEKEVGGIGFLNLLDVHMYSKQFSFFP